MNYIKEYYKKIKTGAIIAPKKVKIVYERLVNDIDNPRVVEIYYEKTQKTEKHNYIFDNFIAIEAIEFIETFCKHSKGKVAGQPFILELWQKAFVSAIF